MLTAAELQRRARDAGLPLTTASVSPGIVATNIWDNLPRFWRAPVRALVRRFCQTPRQARASPLCTCSYAGWLACLEPLCPVYILLVRRAPPLCTCSDADWLACFQPLCPVRNFPMVSLALKAAETTNVLEHGHLGLSWLPVSTCCKQCDAAVLKYLSIE